jgi:hypothetical protein
VRTPEKEEEEEEEEEEELVRTPRGFRFSADLTSEERERARERVKADLTMEEVQKSVRLRVGSTMVLSMCNTGRGKILAEGVVGLSRAFLYAGAAATVVSLWSVDDGSTSALMKQLYKHLKDGRTTAQALQKAMVHLLNGPAESSRNSRSSKWRRPQYWAAFLVVGANTRLPGVDTLEDRDGKGTAPRERKKPSGSLISQWQPPTGAFGGGFGASAAGGTATGAAASFGFGAGASTTATTGFGATAATCAPLATGVLEHSNTPQQIVFTPPSSVKFKRNRKKVKTRGEEEEEEPFSQGVARSRFGNLWGAL